MNAYDIQSSDFDFDAMAYNDISRKSANYTTIISLADKARIAYMTQFAMSFTSMGVCCLID